ncbi:MAG: hypothetical protein R3B72_42500 [Polyangiaceae bacterium]
MRRLAWVCALLLATTTAAAQPEMTPEALHRRAEEKLAILDLADAAEAFTAYARRFPKQEDAPDALREALRLQVGLGQTDRAVESLHLFERLYGRKASERAHELRWRLARALARRGAHHEARRLTERERPTDPVETVLKLGFAARAAEQRHAARDADEAFEAILTTTQDAAAFEKMAAGALQGDRLRRLGEALTLACEARFRVAAKRKAAVLKQRPKPFRGPHTMEALQTYVARDLGPWLQELRREVQETEELYLAVLQVKPSPAPRWVVAAGADVASLWWTFDARLDEIPKPPLPPEVVEAYRASLGSLREPIRARAKAAARICVDYATRYQLWSDDADRCLAWLDEHFPGENALPVTLAPQPERRAVPNPPRILRRGEAGPPPR